MNALPLLRQELRVRTQWPGWDRDMSLACGVSRSHLRAIRNGTANIGPDAAARILAVIRSEEILLADRIEAELNAHWGQVK